MTPLLSEVLHLHKGDVLALSGAGGKTSILYKLAGENYLGTGLYTTTTKMFDPRFEDHPFQRVLLEWNSQTPPPVSPGSCYVAGEIIHSSSSQKRDKVCGLSNKLLENWNSWNSWPILIIEADGAAGKPVKYPSENEPVIPGVTNHTVGCIGLEVLGEKVSESLVHHSDLFRKNLPLDGESEISPETLAALINHKNGLFKNSPQGNKVIKTVILNKMDRLNRKFRILDLISFLRRECPSIRIIGSTIKTGEILSLD